MIYSTCTGWRVYATTTGAMAYVVPIHRASSIRHALKLQFLKPEEESLVVALVPSTLLGSPVHAMHEDIPGHGHGANDIGI